MGWDDIKDMSAGNLREELQALFAKEAEYAPPPPPPAPLGEDVAAAGGAGAAAVRTEICQWKYDVADVLLLPREVVHLSMEYFDRYLAATPRPPSPALARLLALACLTVAGKRQGALLTPPAPSPCDGRRAAHAVHDLCGRLRETYGPRPLEAMEQSLLATLRWRLHPPTPADFLGRYARLLAWAWRDEDGVGDGDGGDDGGGWSAFELAQYQVELAAFSPELCRATPPSAVALAALLNAADAHAVGRPGAVVPPGVRRSFLRMLRRCGGGDGGETAVRRARQVLKTLCPATIVLAGQEAAPGGEDPRPSTAATGAPATTPAPILEYELPAPPSPVGVDIDLA